MVAPWQTVVPSVPTVVQAIGSPPGLTVVGMNSVTGPPTWGSTPREVA